MTLDLPTAFGHYRVAGRLGRGAMGIVYRAIDERTSREVALKVVLPDVAADEAARARFIREAQAVARLQHRNIVTVYDCGVFDESPYIAMELLEGMSVATRLASGDPLTLDAGLSIVIQLCEGLQFAHDCGVVHRDVKPANIWLLKNGGVKLLDFGIAKIAGSTFTRAGGLVGSAAYMSPEQLKGGDIDGRADIFAAGGILYELLTGRRAFDADNITAVMHKILHEEAPPVRTFVPYIPTDVEVVVETALQKDPGLRYERAADLGTDLRLAQYRLTEEAQPTIVVRRPEDTRPPIRPDEAATVAVPRRDPSPRQTATPAAGVARPSVVPPPPSTGVPRSVPSRSVAPPPKAVSPVASRALLIDRRHLLWAGGAAAGLLLAVLGTNAMLTPRPAAVFQFEIATAPTGAVITLDGQSTGLRTPATLVLASRPTRIGLTLVGFEAIDAPVPTSPDGEVARLTYSLRRLLRVRSDPSGARIFLDGRETGLTTPADVPLPEPAPSQMELRWADRRSRVTPITGAMLASGEVAMAALAARTAPPTAPPTIPPPRETEPDPGPKLAPTAAVSVRVMGTYPFDVTGCGTTSPTSSDHELKVTAPCTLRLRAPSYFLDTTRTIDASGGRVEIAVPQIAHVDLRSRYESCTVILGGRAVGSPPVDIELVAGTYTATIQCADRTYTTRPFAVAPGRSVRRLDEFLP